MDPEILLVDEPSIGLEPRFIDMVFEILDDLQNTEGKTIIMVEQNANMALSLADRGWVLQTGRVILDDTAEALLQNPELRKSYLGDAGGS